MKKTLGSLIIIALFALLGYFLYVNYVFLHIKLQCTSSFLHEQNLKHHDHRLKEYNKYDTQLQWSTEKRMESCIEMYRFSHKHKLFISLPFSDGWTD